MLAKGRYDDNKDTKYVRDMNVTFKLAATNTDFQHLSFFCITMKMKNVMSYLVRGNKFLTI